MEKLHYHKILFPLILLLPLQFSSLQLLSAYALPDYYFINCGSDSNTTFANRTFIGDTHYRSYSFYPGKSNKAEDTNTSSGTIPLYRTARIYKQTSSYELNIEKNGTYLVRLHFHIFSSPANLSGALFNVSTSQEPNNQKASSSTSNFWLLSNFGVSNSPVVKEFLLTILVGKFKIHFIPSKETSLAFVNAIEVFVAPEGFIDNKVRYITAAGKNDTYNTLLSQVLSTVHRINVGGNKVTPENDTLLRNWIPDDDFLVSGDGEERYRSGSLRYEKGWATEYIAPVPVYSTAKVSNLNTTWRFNVSKNARHLVRVHFCDIISTALNTLQFYMYIYGNFKKMIDPYNITNDFGSDFFYADFATPFYYDFVVGSDGSGFMNISVGPWNESEIQTSFLNGLEIMEFMKESGLILEDSERNKGGLSVSVIVGSIVGGVALICILLVVVVYGLKCRKEKANETLDKLSGGGSSNSRRTERSGNSSSVLNLNLGLKVSFSEIQNATNNFDKKMMIGEGGFGKVYKGTLRNGMKVAVKRSEPGHDQGLPEFETEIMVLSKMRHRHLVSLIGYCDERSEMILVYEFMEKGTLRDHLYGSQGSFSQSQLSWEQRINICIDSAKGLHYLHAGAAGRIIHRDIKSTNILLDENYVAKVADFGLSRSGPLEQTHVSTDVKGTFGYLDPEYFRLFQLTDKSDVYSFGVVLLEVLCGRRAIDNSLPREQVNLADWGMSWQKKGQLERIIDPLLVGKINPDSLRKFGETAEKCLKERGIDRPTMGDVLWDLEYELGLQLNTVYREPHEDSTVDALLEVSLPILQHFPSHSITVVEEDKSIVRDDGSDSTASEVFSQLRIYEAR